MYRVSFDTHRATQQLQKAGHSARQSEAVVEVVKDATGFNMEMARNLERVKVQVDEHMATKEDIVVMRADIKHLQENMATKADVAAVRADLEHFKDYVHQNMATKADVAAVRTDLLRGILALGGTMVTVMLALAGLMWGFMAG